MNLDYTALIPSDFSDDSRVWVYQSSRIFTITEALQIEKILEDFANNWKSHQIPVKGFGTMFFGQFIVLMADESAAGVSGCSTDSSVHIIKDIEKMTGVQMFNRELLAFWVKDQVQTIPMAQVAYALENGLLQKDTIYFNNLVTTKSDMEAKWLQPIDQSWLATKYLKK